MRNFLSFALFGMAAVSGAIVIDDFSAGTYSMYVNSSTTRLEAVRLGPSGAILGGERDAMVEYTGGPRGVEAVVSAGGMQFVNNESETSGALYLQYDGIDGEIETDFMQSGSSMSPAANLSGSVAFVFRLPFVNNGLFSPVSIVTTVTTSSGSYSDTSFLPEGVSLTHVVPFANFGGADFSDVRRLDFIFIGPAAADFTLDSITTQPVPEPATAAVALSGIALLSRKLRSRGRSAVK